MQYLLITFSITFFIVLCLTKTRLVHIAPDKPNHRSLHKTTTPRTGGLAIMLGVLVSWILMSNLIFWLFLIIALITISLVDDMRGLAVKWRFIAQVIVCSTFIYLLLPNLSWWMQVCGLLMLVWSTNLYNFMDGADGLAGGMGLLGFSTYALAAYLGQDYQLALMSGTVAAGSLAFLFFNFHPAKIFMGDAGSIPIGFLAAAIGFYGCQHALWSAWFPVLVFSPFILDASVTLLKRLFSGEKVWQAHRTHYYQRLVQMGFGHKKTAVFEYIVMLIICTTALLLLSSTSRQIVLVLSIYGFVYFLIMLWIDRSWKQFSPNSNRDSIK